MAKGNGGSGGKKGVGGAGGRSAADTFRAAALAREKSALTEARKKNAAGGGGGGGGDEGMAMAALSKAWAGGESKKGLGSLRAVEIPKGMTQERFNKAVLSLSKQGKVALHHDDAAALRSPKERAHMISDDSPGYMTGKVYFHAFGLR